METTERPWKELEACVQGILMKYVYVRLVTIHKQIGHNVQKQNSCSITTSGTTMGLELFLGVVVSKGSM